MLLVLGSFRFELDGWMPQDLVRLVFLFQRILFLSKVPNLLKLDSVRLR